MLNDSFWKVKKESTPNSKVEVVSKLSSLGQNLSLSKKSTNFLLSLAWLKSSPHE